MQFNWDDNKNKTNLAKHGISFGAASLVFDDPCALSKQERYKDGEERWQTLGLINGVVVLLVAHTFQEQDEVEIVRIISARKATRQERKYYEQNI
ncbi:MAG: BrnT family toxin [Proteobacteria bacterium]|nr:BrnT family toxin [Pseudomonadota bacterium]